MTLRRDTRRWLDEEPNLFDIVLARLIEPDVGGDQGGNWRPPDIWVVVRRMGLAWGGFWAWVNDPEAPAKQKRLERFMATMQLRSVLMGEDAVVLADRVEPEKNAIAKARLQTQNRWRYAASWHPERFGAKSKEEAGSVPTLTITILTAPAIGVGEPAGALIEHEPALPAPKRPALQVLAPPIPIRNETL